MKLFLNNKKIITVVLFMSFIFSSKELLNDLPSIEFEKWRILKEGNISISYTDEFDIPWCNAFAIYPNSIDQIYGALKDLTNYKNIFERVTHSMVLDDYNNIVYIKLDMPYFFANRDYTVKYVEKKDGDNIIFQFYSVLHPDSPFYEDSVTLPRASGQWMLIPLSEGRTKVYYTWNGELLGNFPSISLHTAWEEQGNEVLTWLYEYINK